MTLPLAAAASSKSFCMIALTEHEHVCLEHLCRSHVLALGDEIPVTVAVRFDLAGIGTIVRTEGGQAIMITEAGKAFRLRTAA